MKRSSDKLDSINSRATKLVEDADVARNRVWSKARAFAIIARRDFHFIFASGLVAIQLLGFASLLGSVAVIAFAYIGFREIWDGVLSFVRDHDAATSIKSSLSGVEFLLLSPLPYFVLRSLSLFVEDLHLKSRFGGESKRTLLEVKALSTGLLFAIVATHTVGILIAPSTENFTKASEHLMLDGLKEPVSDSPKLSQPVSPTVSFSLPSDSLPPFEAFRLSATTDRIMMETEDPEDGRHDIHEQNVGDRVDSRFVGLGWRFGLMGMLALYFFGLEIAIHYGHSGAESDSESDPNPPDPTRNELQLAISAIGLVIGIGVILIFIFLGK